MPLMPDTGNGLHPPANLPRPPGMIAPVVIPPNAVHSHSGNHWVVEDLRAATSGVASTMGAVMDGIGGAVGSVVHATGHVAQGMMDTIDAVEGGIQATGRLLPLLVVGALGVYAVSEMGGPSNKRQRLG